MRRELLIGCGRMHDKRLMVNGLKDWENLTTLDFNADHKPDVVHDLEVLPLPFENDSFDEIHAYEVLEHTGYQGDWKFFFAQFSDFWRILKPDGLLFATCPSHKSIWAWGDPSHKRVLTLGTLVFLSQGEYEKQIGKTNMSDFRFCYKADFESKLGTDDGEALKFVIQAKK